MLLHLDTSGSAPLFEQIATSIRRAIAEGELVEGDRLPPARALASSFDVNMHTVLRAYGELKNEGLIDMRRGRGSVIKGGDRPLKLLRQLVSELVAEGRRQGLDRDQIVLMVGNEMA